jgi:hypothetical protein
VLGDLFAVVGLELVAVPGGCAVAVAVWPQGAIEPGQPRVPVVEQTLHRRPVLGAPWAGGRVGHGGWVSGSKCPLKRFPVAVRRQRRKARSAMSPNATTARTSVPSSSASSQRLR